MLLRYVDAIPDATVPNQVVRIDGPLPVRAVFICYEGVNSDTKDTDPSDIIGDLIISNTGAIHPEDLARLDRPQALISWTEAYYGRCRSHSATGDVFQHVLPVYMGYPYDRNVEFVGSSESLEIWVPQFDGTDVESCTAKVYVLFGLGITRYHPVLRDRRVDLGGRRKEYLYRQGTATIILSEADTTNPDSFVLLREPKERLTWGDWEDYLGIWQTLLDIDVDPTYDDEVIDLVFGGETMEAALGAGGAIEIDGGADYLTMFEWGVDWQVGPEGVASARFRDAYLDDARLRLIEQGAEPEQYRTVLPVPPEAGVSPHMRQPRPERIPPAVPGGGGGVGVSAPVRTPTRARIKPPKPKPRKSLLVKLTR